MNENVHSSKSRWWDQNLDAFNNYAAFVCPLLSDPYSTFKKHLLIVSLCPKGKIAHLSLNLQVETLKYGRGESGEERDMHCIGKSTKFHNELGFPF